MPKFILVFCSDIILYKFRGANMTKEELKNFYSEDEKLYDLNENKKFLYMFNHLIDEGYELFIGIDEMQDMIDRLAAWYEIKFPEREFDFYDGKIVQDFAFKNRTEIVAYAAWRKARRQESHCTRPLTLGIARTRMGKHHRFLLRVTGSPRTCFHPDHRQRPIPGASRTARPFLGADRFRQRNFRTTLVWRYTIARG